MRTQKKVLIAFVLLVAVGTALRLRSERPASSRSERAKYESATMNSALASPVTPFLALSEISVPVHDREEKAAIVRPAARTAVRAAVAGTIQEVLPHAGDAVDVSSVLVQISDALPAAEQKRWTAQVSAATFQVREAEVELELALYELQTKEDLSESVPKVAMVEAKSRVEMCKARVEFAQAELSVARHELERVERCRERYRLLAPFSGLVTEVLVHPHQYVDEGDVVLWIESNEKYLEIQVDPERMETCGRIAASIRVGSEWRELGAGRTSPRYNADGSISLRFDLEQTSDLVTGQCLPARVICEEVGGLVPHLKSSGPPGRRSQVSTNGLGSHSGDAEHMTQNF